MSIAKILGVILIAAGVLGLVYGGFNYSRDKELAKIGSLEFTIKSEENVNIPIWLSVGVVAAGAALLLFGGKR